MSLREKKDVSTSKKLKHLTGFRRMPMRIMMEEGPGVPREHAVAMPEGTRDLPSQRGGAERGRNGTAGRSPDSGGIVRKSLPKAGRPIVLQRKIRVGGGRSEERGRKGERGERGTRGSGERERGRSRQPKRARPGRRPRASTRKLPPRWRAGAKADLNNPEPGGPSSELN